MRSLSRDYKIPIGILFIAVGYLFIVQGYPFVWSALVSFRNQYIGNRGAFVGFANFIQLLSDKTFWSSMYFTFIYVFAAIVLKLVLGYIMAMLLNQPIVGRSFFRAVLFLPWALPTLTSVLTWRWMLGDVGGVINFTLTKLHLIKAPIGWLGHPAFARMSVVLVNVWRGTPFFGISILAALQSISPELYEAAKIDGAGAWHRFARVTIPSIFNVILLVTLISTIWTLGDFAIIWLMTRGGPAGATHVFSTYSYIVAFQNLELSKGIAIALFIMPVSVLLLMVTMRYLFKRSANP